MKLKTFVRHMNINENVSILNSNGETIAEGMLNDLRIIYAMGDVKVTDITADVDYLDHAYIIIVLDTQITQEDIFKTVSSYINTLSFIDKKKITG